MICRALLVTAIYADSNGLPLKAPAAGLTHRSISASLDLPASVIFQHRLLGRSDLDWVCDSCVSYRLYVL
jgi:hypothetical protein